MKTFTGSIVFPSKISMETFRSRWKFFQQPGFFLGFFGAKMLLSENGEMRKASALKKWKNILQKCCPTCLF